MSTIPFPTPALALPEGPRLAVERSLDSLSKLEGFEDRISYAHELVLLLHNLTWTGVVDAQQHAAALRRLRAVLQADLGAVVTSDSFNVFDVAARDAGRSE